MKKICFFTVFLVIYCQCFSQKDTSFILPEINIIEAKSKIGMWNIQPTDTTSNVLLTQQLELSSPMHLKTYNPGGNVSFSFHGLGSNHILMLWNGFPINSSFLGQPLIYGLGLLDAGKPALFPGTLSAAIFPGGPGAILALEEKNSTKKVFVMEYGSYKTMRTLLKWENKWKKHRTAPSFSFSRSNNDYHFINNAFGDPNEWFLDRRINADYVHADFHFPYIFSFKKGEFLSSIWWKKTHMGLPSSIKTPQIPENERWSDHTLRYTTQVNILLDRLLIKPAIFFERMNIFYTHKQLNLQSNTETFRYAFRLDANFSWKSNIKTHFTFYDEYVQASSNNYLDKVKDNYAFLKSSIMFHLYRKWNVEIWNHFFLHYWLVPGFKVLFYASDNLHLLAGVAKNIHRPTLNDRYWYPGGNLDLKEEEFWTADVHGTYSFTIYQIQMKYQSSWFYYLAKNWIMWLPDTLSSLWKPQNILRVHGKGTDQSIEAALHSSDYILRMFVLTTLQWVKNKQKELIYNPRTKLTLIGELTIKKFFSISWSTIYVGKRFTNLDNTRYMPYYILHDLKFSLYLQKIKAYLPSIHLMCNNVLNTNYQSIAWFPMPRRLFLIQLTWFK